MTRLASVDRNDSRYPLIRNSIGSPNGAHPRCSTSSPSVRPISIRRIAMASSPLTSSMRAFWPSFNKSSVVTSRFRVHAYGWRAVPRTNPEDCDNPLRAGPAFGRFFLGLFEELFCLQRVIQQNFEASNLQSAVFGEVCDELNFITFFDKFCLSH
jgi:hypothetical protein